MKKIVIANWKMNCSFKDLNAVNQIIHEKYDASDVLIAVPYIYIYPASDILNKNLKICSQDVSHCEKGSYTGEISVGMLQEADVNYCIVGHSERYLYFHETFKKVNQKIKLLNKYLIQPILCVGEPESLKPDKNSQIEEKEDVTLYFSNPNPKEESVEEEKKDPLTSYLYEAKELSKKSLDNFKEYLDEVKEIYKNEFVDFKKFYEEAKKSCIKKLEDLNIVDKKPHLTFIKNQLECCLEGISKIEIDIAYEPHWAVGGSELALITHIREVIEYIKNFMESKKIKGRILYGGAVNIKNINALNMVDNLDGVIIGQASLKKEFRDIIREFAV